MLQSHRGEKQMSRPASKATVVVTGTTLNFAQAGSYTIEYLASGNVQIKLDGGKAHIVKAADYAAITTFTFAPGASLGSSLHVNGVTFTDANPGGQFEAHHNLNDLIGRLINEKGVAWVADNLLINGSQADTFKVLWDYLDDLYTNGENYYNLPLNETFVRLGVAYTEYLEAGGAPLTFVTAKFNVDTNGNGIPQREQSMHDNLLGNLEPASINDKFGANPALKAELLALIPDEYEARARYSGNESDRGGPAHDAARAFDYDKGWDRPDYFDTFLGKVDPAASEDRNGDGIDEQMFYGTLNSNTAFNIVRHEGAGVELALKAKEFGPNGGDYGAASRFYDAGGVLHYNVSPGVSPDSGARADWSFDYAATVLPQGTDETWTFKLFIDIDESEGVQLVEIPMSTFGGQLQGSSNFAFSSIRNLIDIDDATPGIQPYAFGPGEFDIVLEAYAAGNLMASNRIVVHVDGFGI
jgi:hypothetical protein